MSARLRFQLKHLKSIGWGSNPEPPFLTFQLSDGSAVVSYDESNVNKFYYSTDNSNMKTKVFIQKMKEITNQRGSYSKILIKADWFERRFRKHWTVCPF